MLSCIVLSYIKLVPLKDKRIQTVEVKYFNSSSKEAKFVTVDVRKLSLIPKINAEVLILTHLTFWN